MMSVTGWFFIFEIDTMLRPQAEFSIQKWQMSVAWSSAKGRGEQVCVCLCVCVCVCVVCLVCMCVWIENCCLHTHTRARAHTSWDQQAIFFYLKVILLELSRIILYISVEHGTPSFLFGLQIVTEPSLMHLTNITKSLLACSEEIQLNFFVY